MSYEKVREKLRIAAEKDPEILVLPAQVKETLGSDPNYLEEVLGLTKKDLIRLERLGLAVKARYATENRGRNTYYYWDKEKGNVKMDVTGPHRTRWILFKEAV